MAKEKKTEESQDEKAVEHNKTETPISTPDVSISLLILCSNSNPILNLCLNSFHSMAADPNKVEYILVSRTDYEDIERTNLKSVKVPADVGLTEAYNLGAKQSRGELIWVLTDNHLCITKDWDKILLNTFSNHPDKVFYGMVDDNLHNRIEGVMQSFGCTTPVIGVAGYLKQGEIFPRKVPGGGADTAEFRIYQKKAPNCIVNLADKVSLVYLDKQKWQSSVMGPSQLTEEEINAYNL